LIGAKPKFFCNCDLLQRSEGEKGKNNTLGLRRTSQFRDTMGRGTPETLVKGILAARKPGIL
jgi:hypothetical protein